MKAKPVHITTRVKRLCVTVLTAVMLASTVGCGSHEETSWNPFRKKETAMEKLERRFEELRVQVNQGRASLEEAAERTGTWQAVSAFLVVVSGFALVGGAALGSRARRAQSLTTAAGAIKAPARQPEPSTSRS